MRAVLVLTVVLVLSANDSQANPPEKFVAALTSTSRFLQTLVRVPPLFVPNVDRPSPQVAWSIERPSSFPALSLTYQTLSGLDWYTTTRALTRGRESNPLLEPIARHPVALLAAKSAGAAATIYLAERLWKRNRLAAIGVMVAANAATAIVISHNAAVGR